MKCNDCGCELESPAEYHPHAFCVLVKAGYNPLTVVLDAIKILGSISHWDGPWIAPDGQVYHTLEEAEKAGAYAEDLAPLVEEDNQASSGPTMSRDRNSDGEALAVAVASPVELETIV